MSDTEKGAGKADKKNDGDKAHQYQAGSSTDREQDQWKHRVPYKVHDNGNDFPVKWKGKCHCGAVRYELSRDKPLASKYCHCTTCQRMHGVSDTNSAPLAICWSRMLTQLTQAPFQWAAIFHKEDINFTHGIHDLGWYDPTAKSTTHHLPCKVQCAYCRTPIMDEGRNMILLFPTLIEGINTDEGREAFKAQCHMFYPERVVEVRDGLPKFKGLSDKSPLVDEDTGEEIPDSGPKKRQKREDN